MAHEMLVGLNVLNHEGYQTYRRETAELLAQHGGEFGYDLVVSEVLHGEGPTNLNRVFTIRFPSEADKSAFFSNETYLQLRREHFDGSVGETVIIASYQR
jgi:uncharacterized protein (DUF1330 family)